MSTLSKILVIIALVGALSGLVWFAKSQYDANIAAQALASYNKTQLDELAKNQKKLQELTATINNTLTNVHNTLKDDNEAVDKDASEISESVKNSEGADKESSQVLKDTVRELQRKNGG